MGLFSKKTTKNDTFVVPLPETEAEVRRRRVISIILIAILLGILVWAIIAIAGQSKDAKTDDSADKSGTSQAGGDDTNAVSGSDDGASSSSDDTTTNTNDQSLGGASSSTDTTTNQNTTTDTTDLPATGDSLAD